jgi:hypothetical protein
MLKIETELHRYQYEVGEEVVVRLDDIALYDVECGHPASTCRDWTIAAVVGRSSREGRSVYAVSFRHHDGLCVALVDEGRIDGTA